MLSAFRSFMIFVTAFLLLIKLHGYYVYTLYIYLHLVMYLNVFASVIPINLLQTKLSSPAQHIGIDAAFKNKFRNLTRCKARRVLFGKYELNFNYIFYSVYCNVADSNQ